MYPRGDYVKLQEGVLRAQRVPLGGVIRSAASKKKGEVTGQTIREEVGRRNVNRGELEVEIEIVLRGKEKA